MRLYAIGDEERIWTSELVREWCSSGLLNDSQRASLEAELNTELRRTNRALQAVLFIFGTIVVWAALGFFLMVFDLKRESELWWPALAWGAVCFAVADRLVAHFRLYRFGVEEAFAVWSAALLAGGTGLLISIGRSGDVPVFAALVVGTIASVGVYLRFGYVYAAIAAVICAAAAPFFLDLTEVEARLLSAVVLSAIFVVAERLRRPLGEDFPGGDYGAMQAAAWLGLYGVLNLRLSFVTHPGRGAYPFAFYWGTYAFIWILPAVGLYVALRQKHRVLIWASLCTALATLVTNKSYLAWERHSWDPIALGLVLIGTAVAVRRWLSRGPEGQRYGFTPHSVLISDKRSLSMLGTFAGAAQPFAHHPSTVQTPPQPDIGTGGRSGGGGGGAGF
jgi:hypothetical protein